MRERVQKLAATCAVGAVAVTVAIGSSAGAAAGASSGIKGGPGVNLKTKTITIGNIAALSGVAAVLGVPVINGTKAAVDAINASGGVDGFKLKLAVQDAQYVPQKAVSAFNTMVGSVALLENFGSPTTQAELPLIKSAGIEVIPESWDSAWDHSKYLAPIGTPYADDIANGLSYLTKVKHASTTVGLIYQGDAYGADGLRGYNAAVKNLHLHSVGVTDYQDTDTTFTAEAQDMKSLGAKTVVLTSTPTATGGIIGAAAALGYFPTYLIQGPGWVEQLMTANGAVGGTPTPLAPILTKYAYVLSFAAPWNSPSASGMKAMIAAQKKYFPSEIPSVYFSTGYEETMIAAKILTKAIQDKNLSRAGIVKARLTIGLIKTLGMMPAPDYTPALGPPDVKSDINTVSATVPGFLRPSVQGYKDPTAVKGL